MSYQTPVLVAGSLAYFDSLSGPVPCKIIAIASDSPADFRPGSWQTVDAVCTASRGSYNKGDKMQAAGLHFFPRQALRRRRIYPYRVECDAYRASLAEQGPRPAKRKTATVMVYTPWGTTSAVALDLMYRDKALHQITGPKADREALLQTMRSWARNAGYTHLRVLAAGLGMGNKVAPL